jgi:Big-like domain-containing protein
MRKWLIGTAICVAGAIAACGHEGTATRENNECQVLINGIIIYPNGVDLQVRDPFGRGQAIGTTVVLRASDGSTDQGHVADTLHIVGEYNRAGTFSATISRPYYLTQIISKIQATPTPDGCSVNTANVPVTLQLAPDAPPLRAMVIVGAQFLGAPGQQTQLVAHFDANPGVSTAVTWQSSDTSLATVNANGVVTPKCVTSGGTVKITATSVVNPSISAFVNMGVTAAASCP